MALDFSGFLQSCVVAFITVLSVLGNGLVSVVLFKRRRHVAPSSRFVLSLCTCCLVASLLVLPFAFVSSLRQRWEFGVPWCSTTAFVWLITTCANNLTVAAIALDRYFAIVLTLRYSVTGNHCGMILACVWTLALFAASVPLFCGISFVYHPLHAMCFVCWRDSPIFSAFFLALTFLTPALIVLFCYGCIFRIACSKYERKVQIGAVSSLVLPPRLPYGRKPSWLTAAIRSPAKGFAVACVLLGSFFLLWTPHAVVALLEMLGPLHYLAPWQQQVALWASLLSWPSHPFVYGLLNRSIRKNLTYQFGRRSRLEAASPQRVSDVGLLDYTPTFCDRFVDSTIWPDLYSFQIQQKSSDDSGSYSKPIDESSRTSLDDSIVINQILSPN